MTSSRLVRGAKTRMFAFVCLVCVLGAVLFVFHGTQVRLTETQKQLVTCSQQKESFHAQLQVIFEYKERLEKSLNKEKSDHKQTKETLEKKIKDDKDQLETDFASKTDVLQQKNNNLQGQLEELREANEKLLEEKTRLAASLELTKKEIESQKVKNDENIENLKNDWFKKHEDCLQMGKQLEEYKMRALPESDRRNYLEKQHFQIKEENEKLKQELSDCRDKKPSAAPVKNENEEIAPNVPMFKTFSSTPGINPDAVNGASSAKPGVENSKKDEHAVGSMPKKPTQESVVPLIQPGKVDDLAAGQGQIPIPPNPHPLGVLHKPNVEPDQEINNIQLPEDSEDNLIKQEQAKAQIGEPNAFIPVPDANRAEEEDEQAPQFKQPGKNPESYRAGDYDKEQPEEEDEEGELIDDEGDHLKDRAKVKILRQNPRNGGGVMVNPK